MAKDKNCKPIEYFHQHWFNFINNSRIQDITSLDSKISTSMFWGAEMLHSNIFITSLHLKKAETRA